jgi:hypothetical protein
LKELNSSIFHPEQVLLIRFSVRGWQIVLSGNSEVIAGPFRDRPINEDNISRLFLAQDSHSLRNGNLQLDADVHELDGMHLQNGLECRRIPKLSELFVQIVC